MPDSSLRSLVQTKTISGFIMNIFFTISLYQNIGGHLSSTNWCFKNTEYLMSMKHYIDNIPLAVREPSSNTSQDFGLR